MDILIRNVPDVTHQTLKQQAAITGLTLNEHLLHLLAAEAGQPQLILGRWQVFESEASTCADCHQPLQPDNTWLGATADGRIFGPLCGGCAHD